MINHKEVNCPQCGSDNVKSFGMIFNLLALGVIIFLVFIGLPIPLGLVVLIALSYYLRVIQKDSLCKNCDFKFKSNGTDKAQ